LSLRLSRPKKLTAAAAAVLAVFFLATASGRVASGDAGNQLQAATLLVTQGDLGFAEDPSPGARGAWVKASNGKYYEAHDLGNLLAMAPGAALGALSSSASSGTDFRAPSLLARVTTSMVFALLGALGAFFLFLLLRRRYEPRTALLVALALPVTTFYWVYARAAWDVLGASVFIAGQMYFAFEVLSDRLPRRNLILVAACVALASTFRFSLLPFLVLALVCVVFVSSVRRDLAGILLASVVGALTLLPELGYNALRTGSPFMATTGKQFAANFLGGNVFEGFFGLLGAPNRGLVTFAPILLLCLALPLAWSRLEQPWRRLVLIFGTASLLYLFLLANITVWYIFGWGPRYLVPVLPVFFLTAVLAGEALWERRRRFVIALALVSALLSLAPVLVNWNATSDVDPAITSKDTLWPRQQYEVWRGLSRAVSGKNVDVDAATARNTAVFPDVWLVQLAERSSKAALLAGILLLALIASGIVVLRSFSRNLPDRAQPA
jgi:hypothetical protein